MDNLTKPVIGEQIFHNDIPNLLKNHYEKHIVGSGISLDVAKERGYKSILGKAELKSLGFSSSQLRTSGLLIPVIAPDGSKPFCTYRPDHPRKNSNGKEIKYEMPSGTSMRIDVPPRCIKDIKNPNKRLWITEGQKKADALASKGECVIDLLGVWNFKGKNEFGGTTVLADLDYIALDNREVYIVFDSDVMVKKQVRSALDRLTEHLTRRKAIVKHIFLPNDADGKTGVDDYLLDHKIDDLLTLAKQPEVQPSSEKKKKTKYIARFENLVDIVEHENDPHFLVVENGHAVLKKEVTIDNELFIPPPKNKLPWLLPSADKVKEHAVNDTEQKLFEDFENYLRSISDLPDDRLYSFITAWVFHTYLMEKWSHSPYLCFFAVAERGKSRTGKAIIHSSYRGRHTETLREANIFRASQNQGATLFFDCMDIWKKATKQNSEDLLLQRFEKGAKAERVLNPQKGAFNDTEYFDIFGATIIATNEPVHNILDTRCIPIVMQQSSKTFENDPTPEIGLDFRERFTAWRAKYLHKELSIQPRSAKGRLGDILIPIAAIIDLVMSEKRQEFNDLINSFEKQRTLEKSISIEGEVVSTICKTEALAKNGNLLISHIHNKLNEDKDDKEKVTPQKVGRILRSLGFEPARLHGGKRAIVFDQEKLEKLKSSYGIEDMSPMSPDDENGSQPTGITNKLNGDIKGDNNINNDTPNVTSTTSRNHYINNDNENVGDNGDISTEVANKDILSGADPWD